MDQQQHFGSFSHERQLIHVLIDTSIVFANLKLNTWRKRGLCVCPRSLACVKSLSAGGNLQAPILSRVQDLSQKAAPKFSQKTAFMMMAKKN
jgi:hypothetical protein